jgi:uncharacterized protein (TIGR02001 family)
MEIHGMKYVGTAAACGLLASSSLVQAEGGCINPFSCGTWSGNVGFASEYVWQGIAMSAGNPTINGGFDWDSGNHWYFSMWGSNVDYYDNDEFHFVTKSAAGGTPSAPVTVTSDDDAQIELDFYVGYWGYIGGGYNTPYDLGVAYYAYPDARHDDYTYYGKDDISFKGTTVKRPAKYDAFGTGNYAELYAGIGHYFFDDRVKTFAYLSYTNDYNGQNQDLWTFYNDIEIYLPYALTLRLHQGYSWGQYWQKNLFGYTGADMAVSDRSWGWCGYTYAQGPKGNFGTGTAKNTARYNSCVESAGDDNDFFDWGIGLSRSFGQFDFTLDYVWVTGVDNEDAVNSWWAGMDQTGANEIYTDGKLIAAVKMAI